MFLIPFQLLVAHVKGHSLNKIDSNPTVFSTKIERSYHMPIYYRY